MCIAACHAYRRGEETLGTLMRCIEEPIHILEFDHPGDEPRTQQELEEVRVRIADGKRNGNFLYKPMTSKERKAGLSHDDLRAGKRPTQKRIEKATKMRKKAAEKAARENKKIAKQKQKMLSALAKRRKVTFAADA